MKIFNSLGMIALLVFAAVLFSSGTSGNGNRHNQANPDIRLTESYFNTLASQP